MILRRMWILLVVLIAVAATVMVCAESSEFATSSMCKMCHGMMHKPIVEGWAKTAHSKALLEPTDPKNIVADFSKKPPFKKDQIKYILGAGRRSQAYIGADMQLLPGKWDAAGKKWVIVAKTDAFKECIGCHVTGYDAASKTWAEKGVTCEACHGSGKAHIETEMKEKIADLGKLQGDKAAAICARCHSRGKDLSGKSPWPTTWKTGDSLEQHFTLAPIVPGAQNQQYNEFKASKHFKGGMTCTTCHEPHGVNAAEPAQLVKPVNQLCLGCHADIKKSKKHPGVPDGMDCADCHMPQGVHTFKAPK